MLTLPVAYVCLYLVWSQRLQDHQWYRLQNFCPVQGDKCEPKNSTMQIEVYFTNSYRLSLGPHWKDSYLCTIFQCHRQLAHVNVSMPEVHRTREIIRSIVKQCLHKWRFTECWYANSCYINIPLLSDIGFLLWSWYYQTCPHQDQMLCSFGPVRVYRNKHYCHTTYFWHTLPLQVLVNKSQGSPVSMHLGPAVLGDTSPSLLWGNAATKSPYDVMIVIM